MLPQYFKSVLLADQIIVFFGNEMSDIKLRFYNV